MPKDTQHNLLKTIKNGLLSETLPATEPIRKQLLYTHWSAFILPLPISRTICMGFFFAWFSLGFLIFYLCVWDMIFQCVARGQKGNNASGESLIITDPKSELYESMSAYLENEGYVVKAFNLVNPENSDSWNCLGEINGQETMAQIFADVIIQNTGSGKGDHFWDNAEMNLLKALVLYVDQGFPPEARNIGQVYKLLTMSSEKELNSLFDLLPVSHPAKVPYCIYKQASDTVRSGVIIGLGARLQVFQNKLIRQITSYDEIDLTLPGKQKCAYFCITSDQDSTFDFLSSLFMTFIFIKLVRYADKYGEEGKLPVAVHILADELANTGAILELNKKISVIRSRNLSISCIFQNLPQMQNRYPYNQWQEIIGNCVRPEVASAL